MPRARASAFVLLLTCLVSGCARQDDAAGHADLPGLDAGQDVVEWRGSLPCADCESIDTRLVLERRGGEQLYELVEVYVARDGSVSFEESGEWQLEQSLLSLQPGTGGLRRYALASGGVLQVRDLQGRVFPGREHDLLLPARREP